jgi:hypothetical protein
MMFRFDKKNQVSFEAHETCSAISYSPDEIPLFQSNLNAEMDEDTTEL